MNSKVAALTVAFNEPTLLPAVVRQFKKPYLQEDIYHMVLISDRPWHGSEGYDGKGYSSANGADSVTVSGWRNQAEQFNYGLHELSRKGFQWAIICDADEFYTREGIEQLVSDCFLFGQEGQLRAPFMQVYWKLPIFRILPAQTDNPVVAIRTDQIFSDKRKPTLSGYQSTNATLHHFSYVRNNFEMIKKINSFEHSNEFNKEEWFKNVWLNWEINNKNLHPVVPEQFSHAVTYPAPDQILTNYYAKKEHNCR